jgi:hypothetical protein
MGLLTDEENEEIISGIINGFRDAGHVHRQFRDFAQGVSFRAVPPSLITLQLLQELISSTHLPTMTVAELLERFRDEKFSKDFNDLWLRKTAQMRVEGGLMASITAMCVERYLQNGKFFRKGDKSNDLKRMADESRWEIKGARKKTFTLTINQSHRDLDGTFFIVYNGFPEARVIHGIYIVKGGEDLFTPRKKGLNMRSFRKEFFESNVECILEETRLPE